ADFIKDKLIHERQGREAERDLSVFFPAWGARPLEEITPADVLAIIRVVKNRGAPYRAHGLLTIARRFFNWCISQHTYGLQASPSDRLKPRALIGEKKARTRVLNDTEWRGLWVATEKLGYPYGPLIRLLAITGQRKSEVGEANWREIDMAKKIW